MVSWLKPRTEAEKEQLEKAAEQSRMRVLAERYGAGWPLSADQIAALKKRKQEEEDAARNERAAKRNEMAHAAEERENESIYRWYAAERGIGDRPLSEYEEWQARRTKRHLLLWHMTGPYLEDGTRLFLDWPAFDFEQPVAPQLKGIRAVEQSNPYDMYLPYCAKIEFDLICRWDGDGTFIEIDLAITQRRPIQRRPDAPSPPWNPEEKAPRKVTRNATKETTAKPASKETTAKTATTESEIDDETWGVIAAQLKDGVALYRIAREMQEVGIATSYPWLRKQVEERGLTKRKSKLDEADWAFIDRLLDEQVSIREIARRLSDERGTIISDAGLGHALKTRQANMEGKVR